MASQGPFLPNAAADLGTATSWFGPNNVKVDDNSFAVMNLGPDPALANYLVATDFGFSIPSGATIDGIVIEANDLSVVEFPQPYITLTKNGTGFSGSMVGLYQATGWQAYSSNTELFSQAWSDSEINASTFGALITVTPDSFIASTVQLDAIRLTVYYTETVPQQYAYPDADVAANGWTPSSGGSLYLMVDEATTPNDSDYITATAT